MQKKEFGIAGVIFLLLLALYFWGKKKVEALAPPAASKPSYSPNVQKVIDMGYTVIAPEAQTAYEQGRISTQEYVEQYIAQSKAQGYQIPAEQALRDYSAGKITYEEYLQKYIEAAGIPPAYWALQAYQAGKISYDEYLQAHAEAIAAEKYPQYEAPPA